MFTNGQRVDRHEVEAWISQAHTFPYFIAHVEEREEIAHQRIRIIVTIKGPQGEPLSIDNERQATYYALKDMIGMPQIEMDWTA